MEWVLYLIIESLSLLTPQKEQGNMYEYLTRNVITKSDMTYIWSLQKHYETINHVNATHESILKTYFNC